MAADCRGARSRIGLATGFWTTSAVARVLQRSVAEHGWLTEAAVPAVLALAADPETRSPGRLLCPGPWWEAAERRQSPAAAAQHGEKACSGERDDDIGRFGPAGGVMDQCAVAEFHAVAFAAVGEVPAD